MKNAQHVPSIVTGAAMILTLASAANAQINVTSSIAFPTGSSPDGAAIADFNLDGFADAAVTIDGPDRVQLLFGDGLGSLAAGGTVALGSNAGGGELVAFDADNDGDADLAVCRKNQGNVLVLVNTAGTFSTLGSFATGGDSGSPHAADYDLDGDTDLVVVNNADDTISVLTNAAGTFGVTTFAAGPDARGVVFADLDSDGDLDLASTGHDDRTVRIHTNTAGVFAPTTTLNVAATVRPDGIAAADLNGDGSVDLAVATSNNNLSFATIFLRTRVGFSAPINYASGGANGAVVVLGDLECDGDVDVTIMHKDSASIGILPNNGKGTFGASSLVTVGANPTAMAIGNMDGDTDLDLIVTNQDANSVSVVLMGCGIIPGPGDINADGAVNAADLSILLGAWGSAGPADLDGSGSVDATDLSLLLGYWS